jgi:hypothetical protein
VATKFIPYAVRYPLYRFRRAHRNGLREMKTSSMSSERQSSSYRQCLDSTISFSFDADASTYRCVSMFATDRLVCNPVVVWPLTRFVHFESHSSARGKICPEFHWPNSKAVAPVSEDSYYC